MEDGLKVYDRVSEIVSCFSGIHAIPSDVLKKAAHRGEVTHQLVEANLKGYVIPEVSEEIYPFYESFLGWNKKNELSVDWMEKRFFCEDLKITGKPDILTTDNRLIDIKTGSAVQKSWPVQLAGYKYLLEKNGIFPSSYQVLFLQKGKEARLLTYQIKEFMDIFLACHKVYKYFNKAKNGNRH